MTITLDRPPSSAPVDFDSLPPFQAPEGTDATAITDATSTTAVEGGLVRRPGDIGSVAVRPFLSDDTEQRANRSMPTTVLRMDPAIARRRAEVAQQRARNPRRWAFIAGTISVLTIGLAIGMLYSPWMSVRTIDIRGASPELRKTVRSIASPKLGAPMFRLSVDSLRRRIAAQPDISTVTVARAWPEQLVISITSRRPLAVVRINDGAPSTVDATGTVLSATTDELPVIALNVERSDYASDAATVKLQNDALAILNALDDPTRRAVDRVDHFGNDFVLRIGRASVLIGRADDLIAKAMLVGSLHRTGRLPERGTIDVTIPDAVVLTK
jgi:POTRA domain, FtsQ-type